MQQAFPEQPTALPALHVSCWITEEQWLTEKTKYPSAKLEMLFSMDCVCYSFLLHPFFIKISHAYFTSSEVSFARSISSVQLWNRNNTLLTWTKMLDTVKLVFQQLKKLNGLHSKHTQLHVYLDNFYSCALCFILSRNTQPFSQQSCAWIQMHI